MKQPLGLERLPLETLQNIAAYLDATHRLSLCSFSLTSRACHGAAVSFIFQEIKFTVHKPDALERRVDTLVEALPRYAHHVRRVSIKGFLVVDDPTPGALSEPEGSPWLAGFEEWSWATAINEALGDQEPYLRAWQGDGEPVEVPAHEDMAWAPLVNLVKKLPYLACLAYECRNQFPPSLLDAIHRHHPQCRLHLLSFRLRSLGWDTPHPHELALATSPCLYSIKLKHAYYQHRPSHFNDHNEEALLQMIAGLAPNLKEARIIFYGWWVSMTGRETTQDEWPRLPGFAGRGRGSLTSWTHSGSIPIRPGSLERWSRYMDFGSLAHMDLGAGIQSWFGVTGEALQWMASHRPFLRLKTLRIRIHRDEEDYEKPEYAGNAVRFFQSLEPLDELSVSGALEADILQSILSRHGQTLRKLSLFPRECQIWCRRQQPAPMVLEKRHVLQIQAQCPVLECLGITVKRTQGDAREVEIYRTLGTLQSVHTLFLELDCSNPHVGRHGPQTEDLSSFDEYDRRLFSGSEHLRNGHLREAFMNCAVDETLARAIWETVSGAKAGRRMLSLKLFTGGFDDFQNIFVRESDARHFIHNLCRSWLVEPGVRDDEDTVTVTELDLEARKERDKEYTKDFQGESMLPDDSAVHIFRRIWPRRERSEDWRQDWTSFSLRV